MTRSRHPGPCATARAWPPRSSGGGRAAQGCHRVVFRHFANRLGHLLTRRRAADAPA
ncbi:hypothetical protein [Stappia sp.]|uniref:hypothetical protein n=1 Tax=Stappia sp. TaxID=1870903 RepID=UPI0025DAAE5D|nr:hypothetical protein [Stappia sp.]